MAANLLLPDLRLGWHDQTSCRPFFGAQHRREFSTTSLTATGRPSDTTRPPSVTPNRAGQTESENDHDAETPTWRQRAEDIRDTARQRAKDLSDNARQRAEDIRDNARESIQEFREHPAESMKSGAKTFSGMMQTYGPVFVGCHIAVYCVTLAGLYVGVESGLLDPMYLMSVMGNHGAEGAVVESKTTVDVVVEWMKNHTWSEGMAPAIERNPKYASFAVAWIAAKFTEPPRLAVSAVLTPRVARYLGRTPRKDDEEVK